MKMRARSILCVISLSAIIAASVLLGCSFNKGPYVLIDDIPAAFMDISGAELLSLVPIPDSKDPRTGGPSYSAKFLGVIGTYAPDGASSADGLRLMQEFRAESPCNAAPPSIEPQYQIAVKCFRNNCEITYHGNGFYYEEKSGKLNREIDSKDNDWCVMAPAFREDFLRYVETRRAAIPTSTTLTPRRDQGQGASIPTSHALESMRQRPGSVTIGFHPLKPHL